ncbi:MAG: hypothetical protein V4685_13495 [Bacteroidota bacterium]
MRKVLFSFCLLLSTAFSFAQNTGIGTNTPHASAALDITAANKGLLPPRVALTGINDVSTIATPATGLLVYNTANAGTAPNNVVPGYYYYTGQAWLRLSQAANAPGDMQYWNGTQWVTLPAGASGKTLTLCNGVPTWGPCVVVVLATVSTSSVSGITGSTATGGGNVSTDGGGTITARGLCYDLNPNPTIANNVVTATGETGSFTSTMTNLGPSATYYVRAFATNTAGTAYGNEVSFTTNAITFPTIITTAATSISSTSAVCGGQITNDGGDPMIQNSIVYGTTHNPTTADNYLSTTSIGEGSYSIPVTGLLPNTTYYVRAYTGNSFIGPTYAAEISFTTLAEGFFAATYNFDSVKTTSGLVDPTPLPVVNGIGFGTFSGVGAGAPSLNSTAAFRFSLTDWTLGATNGSNTFTSATDSTGKYFEVIITPDQGRTINLSSLNFRLQRSGTGVRQAFVRSSVDGFINNLAVSIHPANAALSIAATNKFQVTDNTNPQDGCTITLGGAGFSGISTPVTFRFYGINAEASGGTFSIDNVVFNGQVF